MKPPTDNEVILKRSPDTEKSGPDIQWTEWALLSILSCGVFFAASILMTGWPAGLIPEIRYPYHYGGDSLSCLVTIQKLIEGSWFFVNDRAGFPFGCNFLDYPVPDTGSMLLLKVLGMLSGSPQAAMNLYFLIGFPVTLICGYVCLRAMHISPLLSGIAALLFVFLPFHFNRINHLFYTWYFVVPVFCYFGFLLFSSTPLFSLKRALRVRTSINALMLLILASFSVYYSFFGCLILFIGAVAGAIRNRSFRSLGIGFAAVSIVVLGVLLNVVPHIHHRLTVGDNAEVTKRNPAESEIYGLKLVQMLLPHPGHRIERLNRISDRYGSTFPLVNENADASLGVVGGAGFMALLCVALVLMCGRQVDPRLAFFSIVSIFLFLFSTIGGFSALFAVAISPILRGWNRASVFIGFGSLTGALLILQIGLKKLFHQGSAGKVILPVVLGVFALGFWEQTGQPPGASAAHRIRTVFESDRSFVKGIEAMVPRNSAVYQLPYMAFPEVMPRHQLCDYGLAIGFLHSDLLRWSYGGIKGREGDLFFRALAREPLERQVEVVTRLGFSGIYIDRRGFEDRGRSLEDRLHAILGAGPQLESPDGNLAFYIIPDAGPPVKDGLSPEEIKERAGFNDDRRGRHQATPAEGRSL
jgi:phosphoglycerol transferase